MLSIPKYKEIWSTSLANKFGGLAQGIRDVLGTDTIFFIYKSEIPKGRLKEVTYGRIVVAYKPNRTGTLQTKTDHREQQTNLHL